MRELIIIAHNIRSTHNVGSLLRTAEGLGVTKLYMTGYTPYPLTANDVRMPHIARKLDAQIHKTALDSESLVNWEHQEDIFTLIGELKSSGYTVTALEQAKDSIPLPDFKPPEKLVIIIGREVEGIEVEVLAEVDTVLEIPMFGKKESFNVTQAAAMALYHSRFF